MTFRRRVIYKKTPKLYNLTINTKENKMKVEFDINQVYEEIEIVIKAPLMSEEVRDIAERINSGVNEVIGKEGGKVFIIKLSDVVRFYSEDQKVKFDTLDKSLEIKMKLYEIEETVIDTAFVRVSKFAIVNVKKIKSIEAKNGGLVINLINEKTEPISRRYVKKVKEFIGMGGR